jgi:hypothetical protein
MTLAVSIRIPDGLVLAVDSLSTIAGSLNLSVNAGFKCSSCGADNQVKTIPIPPLPFPVSTKSAAQKLVKFKDKFGVAFFGNSFVNKKSMLSQIRTLEAAISGPVATVDTVAEKILYHFERELREEVKELSQIPENVIPFGFQVVGFDDVGEGKTWIIELGRTPRKKAESALGITFTGDINLVQKLFKQDPGIPTPQPNLLSYSLQDAVDYAKFLIHFVADYQRFANMIPTVGGDVDIALVTSYAGFKWIERKRISELLEE